MDINNIKEEKEVKTLNYKSKFYEILSSEYVMTYVILNTQHHGYLHRILSMKEEGD